MSSLCSQGPPPSSLALQARHTLIDKDGSIVMGGQLTAQTVPVALLKPPPTEKSTGAAKGGMHTYELSSAVLSTPQDWRHRAGPGLALTPPHPNRHLSGTRALLPQDGNCGQGAREIWAPPPEERAVWKANAFLCAGSRNFSKPAIIMLCWGKRAAPTQVGWDCNVMPALPWLPVGNMACAEHPLPCVPQDWDVSLAILLRQETVGLDGFLDGFLDVFLGGLGSLAPGFLHDGHFPPSSLSSAVSPGCAPTS